MIARYYPGTCQNNKAGHQTEQRILYHKTFHPRQPLSANCPSPALGTFNERTGFAATATEMGLGWQGIVVLVDLLISLLIM